VPKSDHELEAASSPREALETQSFAAGVWDEMIKWLLQRVPKP
jgi:hypothetical protein